VNENGILVVAIDNTQISSPVWKKIKKNYVRTPSIIKHILAYLFVFYFTTGLFIVDSVRMKNPFYRYSSPTRGMSTYTDVVDWIGGYPFETAKPEEIFNFCKQQGFTLEKMHTVGGKMGCNEFVFRKKN